MWRGEIVLLSESFRSPLFSVCISPFICLNECFQRPEQRPGLNECHCLYCIQLFESCFLSFSRYCYWTDVFLAPDFQTLRYCWASPTQFAEFRESMDYLLALLLSVFSSVLTCFLLKVDLEDDLDRLICCLLSLSTIEGGVSLI